MNAFSKRSKGVRGATWLSMALLVVCTGFLLAASQGRVAAVPLEADSIARSDFAPQSFPLEPRDSVEADAGGDPFSIGISCCASAGGACILQAGGCPSGTSAVECPCRPPV